ncbi:MAG: tetraacyldisaccharide 4'-kinase [Acidobacteria bacterium]|nr:tetraacyldisaccharide 4'-kinase [Acidobacteriota bacterium]
MNDEPDSILAPLSALYGAGVAARLALYERGLFRVRRAGRPVVSVGNIAAGGTGKTPFVRWLAGELLLRSRNPSILTRGYGRSSRGTVVVSDGAGTLATTAASGDEAALLARALPRVPIVADARRVRAARVAEKLFPAVDLHLLDDGFSHVALARDVDIVLLDATNPTAGGALLPEGRIREPLTALARADLVVVTKVEGAAPAEAIELARRYAPGAPVYRAATHVLGIRDDRGEEVHPRDLPKGTLVAVAGLAHPGAFFSTLDRLGIDVEARLPYPDHARYGDFRLGKIARAAEVTGATAVITTEKDAVKLAGRLSLPLFRVAIESRVVEPGFLTELAALLTRRPS